MSVETVVVISFNEDGDPPTVEQMTKTELRTRLRDRYYGEKITFAPPLPGHLTTDNFVGLVVIEGRIIEPHPVQVATEYEL